MCEGTRFHGRLMEEEFVIIVEVVVTIEKSDGCLGERATRGGAGRRPCFWYRTMTFRLSGRLRTLQGLHFLTLG